MVEGAATGILRTAEASAILAVLPLPILVIGDDNRITFVNAAAEQFFDMGEGLLQKQTLKALLPFGSPLLQLLNQARERRGTVGERDVDLSTPRNGEHLVDVTATPFTPEDGAVLVTFQERGFAQRLDRQLQHRGAVRSLNGMAAVLAHEIKNPLAGIRGAAQLLEETVPAPEKELTRLVRDEADRINALIDRMAEFGDSRGVTRAPVNIHEVLDRVSQVARSSFARDVKFVEKFDPSLPDVLGNRDQLIQVFLNLVRNACDAVPSPGGEIVLSTGYRPGVKFRAGPAELRYGLPLEVAVRDNGAGVPADLLPNIFDPFVTTKAHGSGLGLAIVAKIVSDHGGIVECESVPQRTVFRVLLPKASETTRT